MKKLLFIAGAGFIAHEIYQRNPSLKWRLKAAKHSLLGWPVIANCKLVDGTLHVEEKAFIYNTTFANTSFRENCLTIDR